MNFVLKPSLEYMALAKVVISLWNQSDVRALISEINPDHLYYNAKWKTIEERVTEKIPQLPLPELLQENVLGFIKPIGLQILEWIQFHHRLFRHHVNLPAELCWTAECIVDRKRIAEVLAKDENLDMSTRYKFACIYCLEDDIIKLWNSMPEDLKRCISHESQIIRYWSRNMRRKGLSNAHKFYKDAFRQCANQGNKVAAEYFLQKLTLQEREESLVKAAKHARDADILRFLLSKMVEEQQIKVFKNNPYGVLKCFLQWPLQSFFIGVANYMWNFIPKLHYVGLLIDIIHKVRDGCKDCNYQKLFREFWGKSPSALKSLITNEIDKSWLLPSLFHIKDKANIRLILKDTSLTAKEKLVYSDEMKNFCKRSIRDNEWEFLGFCIREFVAPKNAMLKFKEEFEKYLMHSDMKEHFETKKHKWDDLFRLSDDSILKYNKRNLEEDESSSVKRFRNLQYNT